MAAPGKAGNRPSEFGGVPGEFTALERGEPLVWHPELEQRAMYRAPGGFEVITDELGKTPPMPDPVVGKGGTRQKSQSFS